MGIIGKIRFTGIKSNWVLIPTVLTCLSAGVLGVLVYIENKNTTYKARLLAMIVAEFITFFLLPFCAFNVSPAAEYITSVIVIISLTASLGAGLSYFLAFIDQLTVGFTPSNSKIFKSFISLFLASLVALGIQLGQCLQPDLLDDNLDSEYIGELDNHKETSYKGFKDKMVSLKASAATLVEKKTQRFDDPALTYQDQLSTMNSKDTYRTVINRSKNNSQTIMNYNIKKLSLINQSTSSTSLPRSISLPDNANGTPTLFRAGQPDKKVLLERDAIKRIPSALLPPHLRVFDEPVPRSEALQEPKLGGSLENSPSLARADMIFKSSSQYNLNSIAIEEEFIQEIPRATTLQDIWPVMHEKQGLKTISLEEWEQNQTRFKNNQIRADSDSFRPFIQPQPPIFEHFEESPIEAESIISMVTNEKESTSRLGLPDLDQDNLEDSTEQALKIVEDVHDMSMRDDDLLLKSAIDLTQSTLHLEDLELAQLNMQKTNSHSPHKSFFKNHSNKSSISSFNFKTQSVPTSPRKKSIRYSPKKRSMMNLSLSSIVFKDENDEIPNFNYVHELQGSASKKRASVDNMHHYSNSDVQQTSTPCKSNTALALLNKTESSQRTPESNCSSGSKNSVFPSEVIGEYDKEKWKTMERLNLVSHV